MPHTAAATAAKPAPKIDAMTEAMLADAHRGHSFAKRRAEDQLAAIEAELDRRGLAEVRGAVSVTTKTQTSLGRVDLKRLRAERPDLCRDYAQPGDHAFWTSRTLRPEERG